MRLVVVIVLALAACSEPGQRLPEWTLEVRGHQSYVELPSNLFFDLPHAEVDYTLRTKLALDNLDQPLTLVVPCFHGNLALLVDGTPALDFGDIGTGEHRFSIVPTHVTPTLTLVGHLDNLSAIGFGVTPYLSGEPLATRGTIASINRTTALIEVGLVGVFCLLYAAMWWLARRPEDGAFVVIVACSAHAPLWQLGLLHTLYGPLAPAMPGVALSVAQIAVLYFMHHAFGIPRPPRAFVQAFAITGLASLLSPIHFVVMPSAMVAITAVTALYAAWLIRQLALLARSNREVRILFTIIMVCGSAVIPDIFAMITGHNLLNGIHTISAGMVGVILTQAVLLSRAHVARQHSLERSADELRRQVAERSRELTVALAELARRPPQQLDADRIIAGRYKILRRLGAGGMGTVYEVIRTDDNVHLALKTLRSRTEPAAMARFTREAEIAAELSHPNLVPVLDVGISDGLLFLVMPLIDGGSLEAHRKRFGDATWARPILAEIATGLAALHARGIVHRDLKPGNVLYTTVAMIADFGLASLDEQGDGPNTALSIGDDDTALAATPSPPLTRAGDIFGTPRYMAPELAHGADAATPSADVFAFGVIAFEMLTGRQPFPDAVIQLVLDGNPIPAPPLDLLLSHRDLVGRCLAPDPSARPTAADLATGFRP